MPRIDNPMGLLVSAKNLKKGFGSRLLFEGVSFSVSSGERIGLIGPNGAGKSTLIALLAGQLEPDDGEVVRSSGVRTALLEQTPRVDPQKSIFETLLEGADSAEDPSAVALEIFRKVGLDQLDRPLETPMGELSGGWQKRVALGREFARRPDLLMIDEPTNHLDIEAIVWLESFLSRSDMAVLTVTHDRAFLQNTSNRILELDRRNPGGLLSVEGDYGTYVERKEALLETQKAQESSLRNRLRNETEWLKKGAKARSTKQKARIDRAAELANTVSELAGRNASQGVKLKFDSTDRKSKKLLEAEGISKSFEGNLLFKNFNLFVGPGSRVGLLGRNGSGKTSLIRSLLGQYEVDSGRIFRADGISIAYFEQKRESLDPEATVMSTVCPTGDHVEFQGRLIHVRSYLSKFLFTGLQVEQQVSKLSGGEQSRLLIARLMLEPSDILVLDEPTNDLDMDTLDVLEECLQSFKGAVILVTHDRYFLDRVSHQIFAFTEQEGKIIEFADLSQWEDWIALQQKSSPKKGGSEKKSRKKTKLSHNESRELESMEEIIHKKEARMEVLTAETQDPNNVSNPSKLTELFEEMNALQSEIDTLFERWQELEDLKKSLESE